MTSWEYIPKFYYNVIVLHFFIMNLKLLLVLTVTNVVCNCLPDVPVKHDEKFQDIKIFPIGNNYPRPSPINLVRSSMIRKKSWTPLHFSPEHNIPQKITKSKRAGGLEVNFDFDGEKPQINGGILKFSYEFEKLFFHWDANSTNERGSYHTLDGEYFPMEVHAYYKIIPPPLIFGELLPPFVQNKIQDTLLISQFFKIDDMSNLGIQAILKDSKVSVEQLIPPLQDYAAYEGSLVVKPFMENVKWIIFLKPQKISKAQLNEFRKITQTESSREIQPLYGRKVFYIRWKN